MIQIRNTTLMMTILITALSRLLPHPPNVTPIAAVALFGGCYFANKWMAILVPLAAMLIADSFIGFHHLMVFVYAGFGLTIWFGYLLRGRKSTNNIALMTVLSACAFFLISNFGVWVMGRSMHPMTAYPMTAEGLLACYVSALPFFRNMLIGNFVYVSLLFGAFELAQKSFPVLRERPRLQYQGADILQDNHDHHNV